MITYAICYIIHLTYLFNNILVLLNQVIKMPCNAELCFGNQILMFFITMSHMMTKKIDIFSTERGFIQKSFYEIMKKNGVSMTFHLDFKSLKNIFEIKSEVNQKHDFNKSLTENLKKFLISQRETDLERTSANPEAQNSNESTLADANPRVEETIRSNNSSTERSK